MTIWDLTFDFNFLTYTVIKKGRSENSNRPFYIWMACLLNKWLWLRFLAVARVVNVQAGLPFDR